MKFEAVKLDSAGESAGESAGDRKRRMNRESAKARRAGLGVGIGNYAGNKGKKVIPGCAWGRGAPKGHRPATVIRLASDRLKLARDIYQYLHSLGEATNPYLVKCGYYNRRELKTIQKNFVGTYTFMEVLGMLRYLSKRHIIRYYPKCGGKQKFYLLEKPLHLEMMVKDDE